MSSNEATGIINRRALGTVVGDAVGNAGSLVGTVVGDVGALLNDVVGDVGGLAGAVSARDVDLKENREYDS